MSISFGTDRSVRIQNLIWLLVILILLRLLLLLMMLLLIVGLVVGLGIFATASASASSSELSATTESSSASASASVVVVASVRFVVLIRSFVEIHAARIEFAHLPLVASVDLANSVGASVILLMGMFVLVSVIINILFLFLPFLILAPFVLNHQCFDITNAAILHAVTISERKLPLLWEGVVEYILSLFIR